MSAPVLAVSPEQTGRPQELSVLAGEAGRNVSLTVSMLDVKSGMEDGGVGGRGGCTRIAEPAGSTCKSCSFSGLAQQKLFLLQSDCGILAPSILLPGSPPR